MYLANIGRMNRTTRSPTASATHRPMRARAPGLMSIDCMRPPNVLVMDNLRVALGTHTLAARQQDHLCLGVRPMDRAHTGRRRLDAATIAGLSNADPEWGKLHEHQVEKGADRRDQRDEQDALHNDCCHSIPILRSAARTGFAHLGGKRREQRAIPWLRSTGQVLRVPLYPQRPP